MGALVGCCAPAGTQFAFCHVDPWRTVMMYMRGRYGFAIHPQEHVTSVGSFASTMSAAQSALWDTRCEDDRASLYRQANGWRFVGYVTYDGRFIDQRVSA